MPAGRRRAPPAGRTSEAGDSREPPTRRAAGVHEIEATPRRKAMRRTFESTEAEAAMKSVIPCSPCPRRVSQSFLEQGQRLRHDLVLR